MSIVDKMVKQFDDERLSLKVVEEMMELSEVLVKGITKSAELKPPIDKVIEEAGDLLFRLDIMMAKKGIFKEVMDRKREKAEAIEKWFDNKFGKLNN